jgi:TPR repeat protein
MYRKGRGVVQDYVKAVEWYLKAAKQGHVYARDGLSNCYKEGRGVEKNLSLAA